MKLKEITKVVRSKNAGPFFLTFDVIFKDKKMFNFAVKNNLINQKIISKLYNLTINNISIIKYPPAGAIKISIPRPVSSGDVKDTDIYGTQQHVPLLDIDIPKFPND